MYTYMYCDVLFVFCFKNPLRYFLAKTYRFGTKSIHLINAYNSAKEISI